MSDDIERLDEAISRKTARKLRAQAAATHPVWFGLGMFGIVGWSVATPTLLGALLGAWLDKHHGGAHSWTLALLVAGLVLGCTNAWYWISTQVADFGQEDGPRE